MSKSKIIKEKIEQAEEVYASKPEVAIDLCLSALKSAQENDLHLLEGKVYIQLIKAYRLTSAHEKALECIDLARTIFTKYEDEDGLMRLDNLSGIVYFYIGMYELAISHLDAAFRIAEKVNDIQLLIATLNNIAEIKKKVGDKVEAMYLYKKSLDLAKGYENTSYYGVIIHNIGDIHMSNGDLDEAEKCYYEAYACYSGKQDQAILSELLIHLGKLYLLKEQPARAREFFDNAVDMLEKVQNKFYILDGLIEIYKMDVETDPNSAVNTLKKAAKLAEDGKITLKLSEIELLLNKHYEKFKNYERALYHFKRHHNILQKMDANNLILKLKILKLEKSSLSSYETVDSISDFVNEEIEIERKKLETLEEINQELSHQAFHDNLTGLANRRKIDKELERIASTVSDNQEETTLGVFMMDIDHFKLVNDSMGHLFGDSCLEKIGVDLKRIADKYQAFAGRYGGEEFILIKEKMSLDLAREIADDLITSIRALGIKYSINDETRKLTLSVGGLYYASQNKFQKLNLLDLADRALYVAKANGRNQFVVETYKDLSTA